MSFSNQIARFKEHFSSQIDLVDSLQTSEPNKNLDFKNTEIHKKLLYSAILDGIAFAVVPITEGKKLSNKKRYIYLIENLADWDDCRRVSLPHLSRFLEEVNDSKFTPIRNLVSQYFCWRSSEKVSLRRDMEFEEIEKYWPCDFTALQKFKKINLKSFCHSHLLYESRNLLVHEFRSPGIPLTSTEERPFYMHVNDSFSGMSGYWNLIYPVRFYSSLCKSVLDKAVEYFKKERVNPIEKYRFGCYLIPELNFKN